MFFSSQWDTLSVRIFAKMIRDVVGGGRPRCFSTFLLQDFSQVSLMFIIGGLTHIINYGYGFLFPLGSRLLYCMGLMWVFHYMAERSATVGLVTSRGPHFGSSHRLAMMSPSDIRAIIDVDAIVSGGIKI